MNRGQLNGYALNGRIVDPEIRVRIDAKGYARVRAGGRVLSYAVVSAHACARQSGIGGRVFAQLTAESLARAAVDGAIGRLDVRSLLAATGRVKVVVELSPLHARLAIKARASIGIKAHRVARVGANSQARAKFKPAAGLIRRGPVKSKPRASIAADGVVYVRRWLRMPVEALNKAFIVSTHHVDARLAALVRGVADVDAVGRSLVRAPMDWSGVVHIDIDPEIHKRLPFDEPAPESRTFRVPEAMTTFYVTDQGASMFRVSPPMQPADTQDYDIEFDGWFPPGDEIVSVELKVVPPMPMPPSYAISSQRVKVWVYAGGTSGEKYKISVTASTNDGRVKEVELIVPIKEV